MRFPIEQKVNLSNDINISFYQEGDNDKSIIFIHGLGSNKKAWLKVFPMLSEEYSLYAIDLPKFLDTDAINGIGMKQFANCIKSFMNKMSINKAIICGHSMGGQIAISFSLENSDRLEKLILLGSAGLETFTEKDKKWFKNNVTKASLMNQTDDQIRNNFDINFYGGKIPKSASFMLEERLSLKKDPIRYDRFIDYILACIQSMLDEPVYSKLHRINVPTLAIFGQNDMLIPNQFIHPTFQVEDILNQADLIPKVRSFLLDKAGHFIQWDQSKILSEKIIQFIKTN